jgi:hypothetical protein
VEVGIFCSTGEGIVCGDLLPPTDPNDCNITALFRYSVSNIGTTDFDITTAEVIVNANEPVSILDTFSTTALAPNETTFGTVQESINICGGDTFTVTFEVVGTTDDGFECSDTDEFQFIPPPITPTPPPPTPKGAPKGAPKGTARGSTPPTPSPLPTTPTGEGTLSPVNPGEVP